MRDISSLFSPKSIAIYGASLVTGTSGARAIKHLQEGGYTHPIIPINPKHAGETHFGMRWYESAKAWGDPIDQALILVRAEIVPAVLEDCAKGGIRSVSILAGGFAESGPEGQRLQDRVIAFAKREGMTVLGPNCLGYANIAEGIIATGAGIFEAVRPKSGPFAVISQSGAVAGDILALAHFRGLGCGLWVSTGNEIDVRISDAIRFASDSDGIKVILMYLETVRDLDGFKAALAYAQQRGVRIVTVRPGKTAEGAKAVASHTGALVSEDVLFNALFQRYGVVCVDSLTELLDVGHASIFVGTSNPSITFATSSGGTAALTADAAALYGVRMASMSSDTQKKLRELAPHCSAQNPVDIGAINEKPEVIYPFLSTIVEDGDVNCLVMNHSTMHWLERGRVIADVLVKLATRFEDKLIIFVGLLPSELADLMRDNGVMLFEDPVQLMRAIGRLSPHRPTGVDSQTPLIRMETGPGRESLDEDKALDVLETAIGVPAVPRRIVTSADELRSASQSIRFPMVAKALISGLIHKTEAGAVKMNIRSYDELEVAWRELSLLCQSRNQPVRMIVEEQIIDPVSEILISGTVDPGLGPFVTVGVGGTLTELCADVVVRCAPVSEPEAAEMLTELRGWRYLAVHRNGRVGNKQELVNAIVAVSNAVANGERLGVGQLREIEINPFILRSNGSCAVDAVITTDVVVTIEHALP